MKKITAYVNTARVHPLVEELLVAGIGEIMVTEYFKPLSQVSRLELLCDEVKVGLVKDLIHRIGTTGGFPPDHDIIVHQHDPKRLQLLPMTVRLDPLEESRLKQFIDKTFRAVRKRLLFSFSVVALTIVLTALVLHLHIERVQATAQAASTNARVIADATQAIQIVHLEQMLAAERLHRGDVTSSLEQFLRAGTKHEMAASVLAGFHDIERGTIDSLVALEQRFQEIVSRMFEVITDLDRIGRKSGPAERARLSQSHESIMAVLDGLHRESMTLLASLERESRTLALRRQQESNDALRTVRFSLIILALLAFAMTTAMWLVARQRVLNPQQLLVEEAKAVDLEGLK